MPPAGTHATDLLVKVRNEPKTNLANFPAFAGVYECREPRQHCAIMIALPSPFTVRMKQIPAISAVAILLACIHSARGQAAPDTTPDPLPIQSAARPFNLSIVGPVYAAGSDARSADFQANQLPGMMETINANLGEYAPLANISSTALDPSKLVLSTASQVRVYFLGEGAGYRNTLGINLDGTGISSGNPQLIFPNASSHETYYTWGRGTSEANRSSVEPLIAGDFVDLGTLAAGQKLDFFMLANGALTPSISRVWTADSSYNSDGIQHMASFAVTDSAYLLMSFEDLSGGGDLDYNDLVFAVEIGAANVQALANPEPQAVLSLLVLGAAVIIARRRLGASCSPAAA